MSQWRGADYPKHFYGHEFRIDDSQVKKLQPIKIPQIPKSRYTRFRGRARFQKKFKRIPKQLNKSVEKNVDQLWDLLRHHDQLIQLKHAQIYAGSNDDYRRKKRTPGVGIESSIRVQERNTHNLKVGHWKYHAYFLIHGNKMGEKSWTVNSYDGRGTIVIHGIRPTHGKALATRPTGTFVTLQKWVRGYKSTYNYLEQSFNEMKPYVRRNVPWAMMKIHIH